MPAMSVGNMQPSSLAGSREAIGMTSPSDFRFGGHWRYADWQRQAVRDMYQGSSWLHQAGIQTLDAIDVVEWSDPGDYEPENGADYPGSTFGRNLQAVAQMVKMQLGLRVATVDLGGWDTHDYQGDQGTGYFASQLGELSQGLAALYTDLDSGGASNHAKRLTMVVMSEFGRSGHQNSGRGTDHGHGNVILVLGGKRQRRQGLWPVARSANGPALRPPRPGNHHGLPAHSERDVDPPSGQSKSGRRLPWLSRATAHWVSCKGTDIPPIYDIATPTPTPTPTCANRHAGRSK